jgi:hypothetical protein
VVQMQWGVDVRVGSKYQHEIGSFTRFFFPLPCPAVELAGG